MTEDSFGPVSLVTYNRMPLYLKALYSMREKGEKFVSSVALAEVVRDNPSVVKKDLSYAIRGVGKPKVGYEVGALIEDIEEFLGYNNTKEAILVGVGRLGQALMGYEGFSKYGLNIVAGFDVDDNIIGKKINGKEILPTGKIASVIDKLKIKVAILATSKDKAQFMADLLVKSGIRGIWNFTPAHLILSEEIAVKNEDLAASFAILSMQLKEILRKEK